MRKILISILFAITIINVSAGNLEIVIEKQTNGGYVLELPKFHTEIKKNMFIYRPELSLIFTSPRKASGVNTLTEANHHSVMWNNNLGFKYKDIYCTNSIGLSYIFKGNNDNLDEGVDFFNTFTIGFQF